MKKLSQDSSTLKKTPFTPTLKKVDINDLPDDINASFIDRIKFIIA
jgi:hypothetical protein